MRSSGSKGRALNTIPSIGNTSTRATHGARLGPVPVSGLAMLAVLSCLSFLNAKVVAQTIATPAAVPFLQQELITPEKTT